MQLILTELSTGCIEFCWTVTGFSWSVCRLTLFYLNCMSIGWLKSYQTVEWLFGMLLNCHRLWLICMYAGWFYFIWTVYWVTRVLLNCILVVLNVAELSQALADLYAGVILLFWFDSGWTLWFDCSWAVFLLTLLLEYFGECSIKVTVLLKYLNHAFSICGCHLFYTLLIF